MSEGNIQPQYIEEDEITLKELILKLKEFGQELLRNWLLIGLITLPFVAWFLYDAWRTPVTFQAPLTFMINEEDGGGGGGLASIASQYGFNIGGGGGEFNKDKIVALTKSGKIVYPVILDSVVVDGKNDLIGNHVIDLYGLREYWTENSKNEKLHNFKFIKTDRDEFSLTENVALKSCYVTIVGSDSKEPIMKCSYDDDTGILKVNSISPSQDFSIELTEKIYHRLSTFYVKQQTEPQQTSLNILKYKADSIKNIIAEKERGLANLKDSNKNVVFSKFQIQERRLEREIPAYANQYAAILQNVESADFLLSNSTPFFQVIDRPFYPLSNIKASKMKSIIIGLLLGFFLGASFVSVRKLYRMIMEEK